MTQSLQSNEMQSVKPQVITLEAIKLAGACQGAQDLFEELFGNEVEVTQENVDKWYNATQDNRNGGLQGSLSWVAYRYTRAFFNSCRRNCPYNGGGECNCAEQARAGLVKAFAEEAAK